MSALMPNRAWQKVLARVLAAAGLGAAVMVFVVHDSGGPRGMRNMLGVLRAMDAGGVKEFLTGQDALQRLGSSAIPQLRELLRARDSRVMSALRGVLTARWTKAWANAEDRRRCALLGLYALGPAAEAAMPDLLPYLSQKKLPGNRVSGIFAKIGRPALPVLSEALLSTNQLAQHNAATALYWVDYDAAPASPPPLAVVTNLVRALQFPEWRLRGAATYALGGLRTEPAVAIPALEERLSDEHSNVRGLAATALGRFGSAASDSVPKLEKLFDDINPNTARYAREAVEQIEATKDGDPQPAGQPEPASVPPEPAPLAH